MCTQYGQTEVTRLKITFFLYMASGTEQLSNATHLNARSHEFINNIFLKALFNI